MKKKRLYILSPSDRFNYGDMLFTYILQHYLGDIVDEIINCASVQSDLSDKGGIPTLSFDVLYNADETYDNYLIVAGGESLFATWPVILSFIYKDVEQKLSQLTKLPRIPLITSRLSKIYMDTFIRRYYKPCTLYPFTIGLFELPNFKNIMYNSVGSVYLAKRKDIVRNKKCKSILKSSAYVSVRDTSTSEGLYKMGVKHSVCPDSAILMSEIFTDDFLEKNKAHQNIPYKRKKYMFFQINMLSAKGKEQFYGEMLDAIYDELSIPLILCPIGTALGHSDDIALQLVAKHMKKAVYTYIDNPNIWDIMCLIKDSCLYVGTSLHGAITAMSFCVPPITHGKKKVEQYTKDWRGGHFTSVEELKETIVKQLVRPSVCSPDIQIEKAHQSIQRIRAIIQE